MEKNYVIVRSDRAGVFFGEFKSKSPCGDKLMVDLENCRRLWYWDGAASLSQLAVDGTKKPEKCKFTCVVSKITISGVIEILECSKKSVKSIKSVNLWKI